MAAPPAHDRESLTKISDSLASSVSRNKLKPWNPQKPLDGATAIHMSIRAAARKWNCEKLLNTSFTREILVETLPSAAADGIRSKDDKNLLAIEALEGWDRMNRALYDIMAEHTDMSAESVSRMIEVRFERELRGQDYYAWFLEKTNTNQACVVTLTLQRHSCISCTHARPPPSAAPHVTMVNARCA